jgi:hypothetical protein
MPRRLKYTALINLVPLLILSACSSPWNGIPDAADTTAPADVSLCQAEAGWQQVTITWTPPADSDFAGVLISGTGIATVRVAKGSSSYVFRFLAGGVSYDFIVMAYDSSGNLSTGVTVSATPTGDGGFLPASPIDGFESGDTSALSWVLSRVTTDASLPLVTNLAQAASGDWCMEFDSRNMYEGGRSTATFSYTVPVDSVISFWLRTDIGTDVATTLVFSIDDQEMGHYNGIAGHWTRHTFHAAAGTHSFTWTLRKDSNSSYNDSVTNKVWLDDISIVADQASALAIAPRGEQDFFLGMAAQQFTARALRADGSTKSGLAISYTVETLNGGAGSIDASGLFTATAVGTCRIIASSGDLSVASQMVTIHPASFMQLPFTYNGTIYQGKTSTGTGDLASSNTITINYPSTASFDADAFFTLEGTINKPDVYNYALVVVTKTATNESTTYFVQGTFSTRLWLRFGPGGYTVEVFRLFSINVGLDGTGDIYGYSYYESAAFTFTVSNSRDEDGRFHYPSAALQSDDFRIANLARDLTYGLTDSTDMIKAIHDFVVLHCQYDNASTYEGYRRKQDAISVLDSGLAVCEGYTSLTNSLLRALGIKAKAVAGLAGGGGHAWTNVLVDGTWFFLDSTWDDPNGQAADSISYLYYLLTTLDGLDGSHKVNSERPERAIMLE